MVITILYNAEVLIIWSFQLPNLMLQLITTFIIIDQISILEWFLKNGVTLKIRLLKIQLCHHRNKLHLINHIQIENSYLVCIWDFFKKKKKKLLTAKILLDAINIWNINIKNDEREQEYVLYTERAIQTKLKYHLGPIFYFFVNAFNTKRCLSECLPVSPRVVPWVTKYINKYNKNK